jgi:phenylalanyl-tRNA synthetase beta chain
MKFTLNWLKEYIDLDLNLEQLLQKLTEIGLEVEHVTDKASSYELFKAVKILEVNKHPNADKLNICKIKTATEELEIVCGAHNVRRNMMTIFAPIGSVIPSNNMQVKKVKIRDVASVGMLCSASELALASADNDEGIMDLPEDTPIGAKIADILGFADIIIEIAITPNRGDCLGVYGIARDLAASGAGRLKELKEDMLPEEKFKAAINLEVESDDVTEFNLCVLREVNNSLSPSWLKARLENIGINSKNYIVDLTNYLSFAYGQPMHAYDLDKLKAQNIIVKNLKSSANINALNGKVYNLDEGFLVVENNKEVISLAGIIGSEESAVDNNSHNILLEAASFSAQKIANMGRKLQLETDSRYRFERNIDQKLAKKQLKRAVSMIIAELGGARSEILSYQAVKYEERTVSLSYKKLQEIAGYHIDKNVAREVLLKLGFNVSRETSEDLELIIPSWRSDVAIEEDVIEEVLRLSDLSKIPLKTPLYLHKKEANYLDVEFEYNLKKLMASLGLTEVISWSFYHAEKNKIFGFSEYLEIINPISIELAVMRNSLVVNLLDIAVNVQNKSKESLSLFEYGKIYQGYENSSQKNAIAAIRVGNRAELELNNDNSAYDIYDIKNDFLHILEFLGLNSDRIKLDSHNLPVFMHPKRGAVFMLGQKIIGYFGELHPEIAHKLGLEKRVNLLEIFIDEVPIKKSKIKIFKEEELQQVNRDFSFIVARDVSADAIRQEILKYSADVKQVRIFDLYQDEKLGESKKSLAFQAVLQPVGQSYEAIWLEEFNQKIIEKICNKFKAELKV